MCLPLVSAWSRMAIWVWHACRTSQMTVCEGDKALVCLLIVMRHWFGKVFVVSAGGMLTAAAVSRLV